MEFSRQKYWSGLPFPSPGDLIDPGIKLGSPALQAEALPLSHQGWYTVSNYIHSKESNLYFSLCPSKENILLRHEKNDPIPSFHDLLQNPSCNLPPTEVLIISTGPSATVLQTSLLAIISYICKSNSTLLSSIS